MVPLYNVKHIKCILHKFKPISGSAPPPILHLREGGRFQENVILENLNPEYPFCLLGPTFTFSRFTGRCRSFHVGTRWQSEAGYIYT